MADNHEENVKVENGDVAAGENSSATTSSNGLSKVRQVWNNSKAMKDPNFSRTKRRRKL